MQERNRFEHEIETLSENITGSSEPKLREIRQPKAQTGITTLAMRRPAIVRARILWPALGFPAVISPRDNNSPKGGPFSSSDATRTICVLLLSDQKYLSKQQTSRYLRCVQWQARHRRHIRNGLVGTFREEDLEIRNFHGLPGLGRSDKLGETITFGGDREGEKGIVANLAKRVIEFYREQGLRYLHEIRVNETRSSQLGDDLYHLFWNNESENENAPSDEMYLLLQRFARKKREKIGHLWKSHGSYLIKEYEYEYGAIHPPYRDQNPQLHTRAEILHPLFVHRHPPQILTIGHLTDTHVDVRPNVYEENLKRSRLPKAATYYNNFKNWNKNFVAIYDKAKKHSDVLVFTGDLIDYGRGHWGLTMRNSLGRDDLYQEDRNWFLFYYLLASGKRYTRPVYTILGNHDWRLNPYPPLALAGAPAARSLFVNGAEEELKKAIKEAHGPGHHRKISYNDTVESRYKTPKWWNPLTWPRLIRLTPALVQLVFGKQTLDIPGLPTETTIGSVEWYLFSINPFLDYYFFLASGHGVLMLDWAEDENVAFGEIFRGRRYIPNISRPESISQEGPKASNCLTDLQWFLVKEFTEAPGRSKIIGIHAPPIGPWEDWNDAELLSGWKEFDPKGRGYPYYSRKNSEGKTIKGHPLFSIRPKKSKVPNAVYGMDASFGSFEKRRTDFVKRVANSNHSVRLVLSGHIHRQGMFVTYMATKSAGPIIAGEMLVKSVVEAEAQEVLPPAGALKRVLRNSKEIGLAPGPLYINGTSVGPLGHYYPFKGSDIYVEPGYTHIELSNDGTIKKVELRRA